MRLVDLLVRFNWANPDLTYPLITVCANTGLIDIEDSYLTTKLLKAMGCEL